MEGFSVVAWRYHCNSCFGSEPCLPTLGSSWSWICLQVSRTVRWLLLSGEFEVLPVMLPRDEKKLSENFFYIYKLFKTSAQWIRRVFFLNTLCVHAAKVVCSTHVCKLGSNEHDILTLPIIYFLSLHCTIMAVVFIIQERFQPGSLTWLHLIPIYRRDAHRCSNLNKSNRLICQVCDMCRFLLVKPNRSCALPHLSYD